MSQSNHNRGNLMNPYRTGYRRRLIDRQAQKRGTRTGKTEQISDQGVRGIIIMAAIIVVACGLHALIQRLMN